MEGLMVVSPECGHKADIRQIVGRDWTSGRKSATCFTAWRGTSEPQALMS